MRCFSRARGAGARCVQRASSKIAIPIALQAILAPPKGDALDLVHLSCISERGRTGCKPEPPFAEGPSTACAGALAGANAGRRTALRLQ